jgi:predicted transcriptional regulator
MKTAISIPDAVFQSADALAERLGLTRSALYARALETFIAEQRKGAITKRLNTVYERDARYGILDPEVGRMQTTTLARPRDW